MFEKFLPDTYNLIYTEEQEFRADLNNIYLPAALKKYPELFTEFGKIFGNVEYDIQELFKGHALKYWQDAISAAGKNSRKDTEESRQLLTRIVRKDLPEYMISKFYFNIVEVDDTATIKFQYTGTDTRGKSCFKQGTIFASKNGEDIYGFSDSKQKKKIVDTVHEHIKSSQDPHELINHVKQDMYMSRQRGISTYYLGGFKISTPLYMPENHMQWHTASSVERYDCIGFGLIIYDSVISSDRVNLGGYLVGSYKLDKGINSMVYDEATYCDMADTELPLECIKIHDGEWKKTKDKKSKHRVDKHTAYNNFMSFVNGEDKSFLGLFFEVKRSLNDVYVLEYKEQHKTNASTFIIIDANNNELKFVGHHIFILESKNGTINQTRWSESKEEVESKNYKRIISEYILAAQLMK